jgi:HEAT repeat protein
MDAVPDEQTAAWLRDFAARAHDDGMGRQAVESLGFMKRSDLVVPFLKSTLEGNGSQEMRAGAAEGLGHHPSTEIVRLLASHARADRSSEVRRAAVEALGQLQTQEALEELLAIARASEGDDVSRRAAYDALGEKVSRRAETASGENTAPDLRTQGTAIKTWKLDEGESEGEERDSGPPDQPSVAISEGDLQVQGQAIEALGRYPEAQSLPRLRRIAETSPNGDLRARAVESIGRLGTPAALQLIEQIVWKNGMEGARRSAVDAIGREMPDDQALEKLSAIARTHPSPDTRRHAVEMAGRLDSPGALALLLEVVAKGTDTDVQRQAVESLGRRDEPGVEGHLLEIARTHRSVDVRRQAVESLGRIEGKQVQGELLALARQDGPEDVQRQAVESLGRLDQDVMGDLEKIARSHPSGTVRHQAVESMMQRDPDHALKVIEQILREPKGRAGT